MRVLIAEDEPIPRLILQSTLENFGHACLVAEDGQEAWEVFQSTLEVDVVISDWMMPIIDGLELCRRIRAAEKDDGYPYFIFLTALGDKGHLLEGMQEGADDYLSKPLDPEELQVRMIAAERVTSLHRQLSEQKAKLYEQARKDPLTKIGNRLSLNEDLEVLRGRVERYGHSYCAVLCDVDCFKLYNDHYGHLAGDEVLRVVAKTLEQHSRSGDAVYRYGGEEFLIIMAEQALESSAIAADLIRQEVEGLAVPHDGNEPLGVVTISAGVAALTPGENKTTDKLLKEADAALYRAKESGRNCVVVSSTEEALKRPI
jgi:two-component system, cell cycle response regulator